MCNLLSEWSPVFAVHMDESKGHFQCLIQCDLIRDEHKRVFNETHSATHWEVGRNYRGPVTCGDREQLNRTGLA